MFLFPSMDGRWTGPFMLIALVIALVAATRLNWRIRTLVRADAPVTKVELFVVGVFTFTLAAGSVLVFLASQVWVYHEAEIWGCALALAVFDCLTAYILRTEAQHADPHVVVRHALDQLAGVGWLRRHARDRPARRRHVVRVGRAAWPVCPNSGPSASGRGCRSEPQPPSRSSRTCT